MSVVIVSSVRSIGMSRQRVERIIEKALRHLRAPQAAVSVHFVGEAAMRQLNRVHRGIDRATDVLSFSAREGAIILGAHASNDWGDIVLCVPYLKRQAKAFGVSYTEECARMLIHGLLHIAGYDHDVAQRAKKMFALQERLLHDSSLSL